MGRLATYAIGLGSFSVSGRILVPNPPAITTAFMIGLLAMVSVSQQAEQLRHPEVPERQREEEKEAGADADDPAVDAVGEPSPPRGHGQADEQEPGDVGQNVAGEKEGNASEPLPTGERQGSHAERRPPQRPAGGGDRGDDG